MTIEQAMTDIDKELKCRKEEINCEDYWCHECPAYVSYEDLTETLQIVYDWISYRKEKR